MADTSSPRRRPSMAALTAAENRADALTTEVDDLRARLQVAEFERDSWRSERLDVPEAEALARCVRAIDTTLFEGAPRAVTVTTSGTVTAGLQAERPATGYLHLDDPVWRFTPGAIATDESPVGRILLHLAALYGVPLMAWRPPEPTPPSPETCHGCGQVVR